MVGAAILIAIGLIMGIYLLSLVVATFIGLGWFFLAIATAVGAGYAAQELTGNLWVTVIAVIVGFGGGLWFWLTVWYGNK